MGITDKGCVTLQTLRVGHDVAFHRLTPSLFFSFNEHLHIDGQCAVDRHERFQGFEDQHGLAFIVGSPPTIEVLASDRRLKRRRFPQVHRINRLHIVMPINKKRWFARSFEPFTIDQWMPLCRDNLNAFKTYMPQLIGCVLCGPANISGVFWQCTDTGDAQPAFEVFEKTIFVLRNICFQLRHNRNVLSGRYILSYQGSR